MKSKVIAEAEEGTILLFREKSQKGFWLKLYSYDGTTGWMPADRTDFKEVQSSRETQKMIEDIAREDLLASRREPAKPIKMEDLPQPKKSARFRLAPFSRWASESLPAKERLGLRADMSLGHIMPKSYGEAPVQAWAALEGSLPSPALKEKVNDYTFAARYVWRKPFLGLFSYGPDMGYSVDKVHDKYRHHFSLGLSGAVHFGVLDFSLRGGYDIFARSRYMLDLQLGVSF
jgi:hypothetical protein